jgi:threonine dehydrogenase-like Zn-dependent dehydrogenase
MYGPGDVRVEERDEPRIVEATDALIRISAACVCGSDLWPYRGIGTEGAAWPTPMDHEYVGVVEEVGKADRFDAAPLDRWLGGTRVDGSWRWDAARRRLLRPGRPSG